MNTYFKQIKIITIIYFLLGSLAMSAQMRGIWLPPNGGNQKSVATQYIGLVEAKVSYHSPNIINRSTKENRKGKIWGQLVPYGTGKNDAISVWRAGANKNTVLSVSHDVLVNGHKLPAGKYGIFMIPTNTEWTVIFSNESRSWGSSAYDQKEDFLRIKVQPEANEFTQWLAYEFTEKEENASTVVLKWDLIKLPIRITVPNSKELYVERLRSDLKLGARWSSESLMGAVNYCINNDINLEEAMTWVDQSIATNRTFSNLTAKARLLTKKGEHEAAKKITEQAVTKLSSAAELNTYGYSLLNDNKIKEAIKIFLLNIKKHPNDPFIWGYTDSLGEAYLKDGNKNKALKFYKIARKKAPLDQHTYLDGVISRIK
jgi:tetratricopeptide (TPR) repeat protein